MARSAADSWPSVDEWREQRNNLRTSNPPSAKPGTEDEPDEARTAGDRTAGSRARGGRAASSRTASTRAAGSRAADDQLSGDQPEGDEVVSDHAATGQIADASDGQAQQAGRHTNEQAPTDGPPGTEWPVTGRRSGDAPPPGDQGDGGWHSEVLAGSSWFSPDQAESDKKRSGKGRRTGRSNKRSGKGPREPSWLPDGPDAESQASAGPPADPESVARAICLRLLTMAPKTRAQLAEALRKRDVPDEAAEAVLSRFSELGLINDEAFAAAWVDSRHHGRGLAKRALAAELRHRGVDNDTVKEAVERLDSDQEAETARRLVDRKLSATRSLDSQTRTRRLAGMLARKGYSSGLAFRVIREALEQEGIDLEEDFS
jgi:regulatory protein